MIGKARPFQFLAAIFLFACAGVAGAQQYPAQPIKIIVPTAPGGIADQMARVLAQKLGESGKTIVVENRTGAAGTIAADAAAKSVPDGYTLYMGFHGTQSILPHLMRLPYDAGRDFAPVILIASSSNVLIVHPSVPAQSVRELVAYAKANPGKLSYASQGNGSTGHLAGEQFKQVAGIDLTHVPYRGAAPALQDLVAGQVSMLFDIVPLTREQLAAGRVRALGVTAAERLPAIPDVPTMTEAGMPAIEAGPWFGLLAPAATPRAIIDWLNSETKKAFSFPDVRDRLTAQGLVLPLGSPDDFAKHIAAETKRWGEVIRAAGIRME